METFESDCTFRMKHYFQQKVREMLIIFLLQETLYVGGSQTDAVALLLVMTSSSHPIVGVVS